MSYHLSYPAIQKRYSRFSLIALATIVAAAAATIGKDFLFSRIQDTSFYFSESLLFSSYWLLFIPVMLAQWRRARRGEITAIRMLTVILSSAFHLLAYPALVWLVSAVFYPNTFSYWQTFNFGVTEYSLLSIIIYGMSTVIVTINRKRLPEHSPTFIKEDTSFKNCISSILVSESNNKKIAVAVEDVLYFSSNSPYVNIHHPVKKYLATRTLKSLAIQLNAHQFTRIHRSCIVNIHKVVSYTSRMNGDYDLTLIDETIVRLSRNYAADFKRKFEEHHQVTTK